MYHINGQPGARAPEHTPAEAAVAASLTSLAPKGRAGEVLKAPPPPPDPSQFAAVFFGGSGGSGELQ